MSESPITTVYHCLTGVSDMPPFDWMVEWMGEPTIERAWEAEADAEFPSPGYMLAVLQACPTRKRDVIHAAAAMVAVATQAEWLREVAAAILRNERPSNEMWRPGYRSTTSAYDKDVAGALRYLSDFTTSLTTGDFMVAILATATGADAIPMRRRMARAVVRSVEAPTVAEIMAALERR